jgi:membrane protease YdiL (CAAX protease family)
MEPSRDLSRKAFTAAVLFESSLGGVALGLGALTDVAVFAMLEPDPMDALLGVVLTLPPLGFLALFTRTQFAPLRRIREALDTSFVPLFRKCTWDELLAMALVAGLGEELLFRGWMQPWITPTVGPIAALVVTSIAFGLVHAVTPAYALLAGGIGLYLGGIMLVTDSLLVPIVVHGLYDFVAFLVLLRPRHET